LLALTWFSLVLYASSILAASLDAVADRVEPDGLGLVFDDAPENTLAFFPDFMLLAAVSLASLFFRSRDSRELSGPIFLGAAFFTGFFIAMIFPLS